jgi:hypothetical protein
MPDPLVNEQSLEEFRGEMERKVELGRRRLEEEMKEGEMRAVEMEREEMRTEYQELFG